VYENGCGNIAPMHSVIADVLENIYRNISAVYIVITDAF
jgi:hypothetical protein